MPSGLKGPDMDFVFWIILIVLIVGVVWWLLNRGSSSKTTVDDGRGEARPAAPAQEIRADGALSGGSAAASAEAAGTAGIATAAGFGRPSEPVPPTTADDTSALSDAAGAGRNADRDSPAPDQRESEQATPPAEVPATPPAEAPASPAAPPAGTAEKMTPAPVPGDVNEATAVPGGGGVQGTGAAPGTSAARGSDDQGEWETQWSEAGGSPAPRAAASAATARTAGTADTAGTEAVQSAESTATGQAAPVHHPEYTEPHSPTLPGAESAAAELGNDQPAATVPAESGPLESSPPDSSPAGSGSVPEASGHLAADRPYGEGSASPAPDGSGPADYTVKGDAGTMVYYEEGHPEYEQTRAGVWFESAAHAEAAGFRAPRRTRLQ
jgi:hypothetical protein